jgi:thiamine biosynthesis lipoprotein
MSRPPSSHTSRVRVGLGTLIAIEAQGATPEIRAAAIEAAMACCQRVELSMHPSRQGSDLAALAAAPAGSEIRVDPWTVEVLRLAQNLSAASAGVFDPCLPHSPGGLADVQLISQDRVRTDARVRLDLGGIAKGFAVDCAVQALRAAGCEAGLVNAGGDARAFGPRGFPIECRAGGRRQCLELREAAVAVSCADAAGRPPEHRGYYLRAAGADAQAPSLQQRHAIVLAASAAVADGLTKCWMLAPAAIATAALEAFDARALPG